MTKDAFKKTAQVALKANYGFAPALSNIVLLEACDDRTYILFRVGSFEYRFKSWKYLDGSVWCGRGTVEQTAVYKWTQDGEKRERLDD